MVTTTETWTQINIAPRQLDPKATGLLAKLWIAEEWRGRTRQEAYHDATPIKYVMVWADPVTSKTVPLNWNKVPHKIQAKIIEICRIKHNPWTGCRWSDSYDHAEGDTIYKTQNSPRD